MTYDYYRKEVIDATFDSVVDLSINKGNEYASKADVFKNFKAAKGRIGLNSPIDVAMAYKLKHDISLETMIHRKPGNPNITKEYIDEKINDNITYLLLIKGMLYEREGVTTINLPF